MEVMKSFKVCDDWFIPSNPWWVQQTNQPLLLYNLSLYLHSPFVPISSSPRPYPARGERTVLIQVSGGGGGVGGGWGGGVACFQVPLLNGSLCQDPWAINMTMWQCGRAFLKEILCLLSVFPPEEPPQGRVRRPEKCPWKTRKTLITQCERDGPFD